MTRTELELQMANSGKTGLLIASETSRELLQARIDELEEQLAAATAVNNELQMESKRWQAAAQSAWHALGWEL